jgi:hypothetical protein
MWGDPHSSPRLHTFDAFLLHAVLSIPTDSHTLLLLLCIFSDSCCLAHVWVLDPICGSSCCSIGWLVWCRSTLHLHCFTCRLLLLLLLRLGRLHCAPLLLLLLLSLLALLVVRALKGIVFQHLGIVNTGKAGLSNLYSHT